MNPFTNLFKTKKQLQQELATLRATVLEAETALTNCDRLAREIDGYISQIKGRPGTNPHDIRHVRALESLKRDLPEIRTFWEKRRQQLAA